MRDFNSALNGQLHEQEWVEDAMAKYHNKMSTLKPYYCKNCHELWPSYEQKCTHCKKNPFLWSAVSNLNNLLFSFFK